MDSTPSKQDDLRVESDSQNPDESTSAQGQGQGKDKHKDSPVPPSVLPKEVGGPEGLEPTRFGDWERNGRCTDF